MIDWAMPCLRRAFLVTSRQLSTALYVDSPTWIRRGRLAKKETISSPRYAAMRCLLSGTRSKRNLRKGGR